MSAEAFPKWEAEGFGDAPATFTATGSELLLRAYCEKLDPLHDFMSRRVGNCFFVPSCAETPDGVGGFTVDRALWTGAYLEKGLNAFVFGNAYERIGVWALQPGVKYRMGPIGFDTRTTREVGWLAGNSPAGLYRHMASGYGDPTLFRQVVLDLPDPGQLSGKALWDRQSDEIQRRVRQVDDFAVVMPLSARIGHA